MVHWILLILVVFVVFDIYHEHRLGRTKWKTLDRGGERCLDSEVRPNTLTCITRFIEEKAGCTLPVLESNMNNKLCDNISSLHKFVEMSREHMILSF